MFSRYSQDFSRMFSGCYDGSYGPGGIWWSFQMKVWTLMIQRNPMIPSYSMIPAIRWSPAIPWSPTIRWSIGSMDFDYPKVSGDTSITDGLVFIRRVFRTHVSRGCNPHACFFLYLVDIIYYLVLYPCTRGAEVWLSVCICPFHLLHSYHTFFTHKDWGG